MSAVVALSRPSQGNTRASSDAQHAHAHSSFYQSPFDNAVVISHDVTRTAAFLELPYGDAQPCPVNWQTTSLWVAGPQQALVMRLYNLLYANLMRAIWSGATPGWDANDRLARYAEAAGLSAELIQQPDTLGGANLFMARTGSISCTGVSRPLAIPEDYSKSSCGGCRRSSTRASTCSNQSSLAT